MSPPISSNAAAPTVALWVKQWKLDIYRYCRRFLRNDAEAEDVTQRVFLQAYEAFPTFRSKSSPHSWLREIARHECLDRLKFIRRSPSATPAETTMLESEPAPAAPLDDALATSQAARALEGCLDDLPDHTRAAIVLKYNDDLSYEEIERLTGVSIGALRVRVMRALPLLKHCLDGKGVDW